MALTLLYSIAQRWCLRTVSLSPPIRATQLVVQVTVQIPLLIAQQEDGQYSVERVRIYTSKILVHALWKDTA